MIVVYDRFIKEKSWFLLCKKNLPTTRRKFSIRIFVGNQSVYPVRRINEVVILE